MPFFLISRSLLAVALLFVLSHSAFAQENTEQAADQTTEEPDDDDKSKAASENAGESDLDTAVIQKFDAKTSEELDAVAALLESAIKKGLDEEKTSFAKKLLGSVLLQRSRQIAGEMVRVRGRRQIQMRDDALRGLEKAVQNDPSLVEAYFLIARLNLLPNGDPDAIRDATTKAIELLDDDPVEQSAAYVLRALTQDTDEKRIADLDAATEKDPKNVEAFQARAALRMRGEDVEGAVADLQHILSLDPTNTRVAQSAVQQLVDLDRLEDALKLLSKTIEAKPSEGLYNLRALLFRMEGKEDAALSDLNKALALRPNNPRALLQRAEVSLFQKNIKSAKRDLKAASEIDPRIANDDQAVFVRCLIAVEEGRMADAINDMLLLVSRNPANIGRQIQLANLYLQDERPRKAIDVYTTILDQEGNNPAILRARGDALLSVGDHTAAIGDYEQAIKAFESTPKENQSEEVDFAGILNNLAWVLCTSTNDKIRDGKRAVELGEKAAKLTDFKEAHILSTLAAGYAEIGDFEKAIEWSTKAVDLGKEEEHNQIDQLELELESYRKGEAWREKQELEENDVPILSPDDLIDT